MRAGNALVEFSSLQHIGLVWVSRRYGHPRTQGYEDAVGDSLRPLKYIHLRELTGNSGPYKKELTGNSGPAKACTSV